MSLDYSGTILETGNDQAAIDLKRKKRDEAIQKRQEKIYNIKFLAAQVERWSFLVGLKNEMFSPELKQAWQELNKYLEENI